MRTVTQQTTPTRRPNAPIEPQFGFARSLAYSAILIVLLLGLVEGGIRVWVYFFRAAYERFDAASQTFVLVPGEHRNHVRVNSEGFVGRELQPDAPDLFRIYTLGDSCTFGGGNETDSYPAMLGERLARRDPPGLRYEVVNAGIQGLNSELALRRLEAKGPRVRPEVVTIYIGWNDLMKFDPLAQGTSGASAGVARALDELWLVKGLRKLLFFHARPRLFPPRTGPESRSGRFRDFQPTIYERNLRAIVAEVRRQGARPLLMTLPTVVRDDMDVEDLRRAGVMFPYFPSANAVGDFLDLLEAYNRTVRGVAAEQQVPLLELAESFRAMPDARPYFYDTMHATAAGWKLIAEGLEASLDRSGLLARPSAASQAAPAATAN